MVSRDKKDKGVLAFTSLVGLNADYLRALLRLTTKQRQQLTEEIRVYFTSKNMGYWDAIWPLDKIKIQTALPLDAQLSEHSVDLKVKEIINTEIGGRSIIQKTIASLELDKEDSQT